MNLVIDIGNTRSKYAFFQEDRLIGVNYRLDSILEDIRVQHQLSIDVEL